MKKKIVMLMVLAMMFVLAACGGNAANTTKPSTDTPTKDSASDGKSSDKKVVNIGFTGPLSGPAATYGQRTLNGLEMAAEEINTNGGFDVGGQSYEVKIVPLDDKYLPNEAGSNAQRLLQENKTPIIFTPHSGGVFALQVFNETDKFLLMAYTSEPKVTEAGNSLTVRIPPRYDGYMQPFTDYEMKKFGKKLAALPTSTQYGKDWTEKLLPYWKKQGGEVVYDSSVDFNKDTDFFTIVTNALKENPDVLFIGGPSEPTAKVAKQARELGFKGGFIVMDQAKLDEMSKVTGGMDKLEGSVGVMPLVDSSYPGTEKFIKTYQEKYGEIPGSEAAWNYVALNAVVGAMQAAGTVEDPDAIRAKMNDGIKSIPEEKQVYVVNHVGDDGGFEVDLEVAAIEAGKVKPIPVSK